MVKQEDIKQGSDWEVTVEGGLAAGRLRGDTKGVTIPKGQLLTIIRGDARKPGLPENAVCFSAADVEDKTKLEHYGCHLHVFQKCCDRPTLAH